MAGRSKAPMRYGLNAVPECAYKAGSIPLSWSLNKQFRGSPSSYEWQRKAPYTKKLTFPCVSRKTGSTRTPPSASSAALDKGDNRIIVGGGWDNDFRMCNLAARYSAPPTRTANNVGFRVRCAVVPAQAKQTARPQEK